MLKHMPIPHALRMKEPSPRVEGPIIGGEGGGAEWRRETGLQCLPPTNIVCKIHRTLISKSIGHSLFAAVFRQNEGPQQRGPCYIILTGRAKGRIQMRLLPPKRLCSSRCAAQCATSSKRPVQGQQNAIKSRQTVTSHVAKAGGQRWGDRGLLEAGKLPPPPLVIATEKSQVNMVPKPTIAWTRA